jgi:cytidine deaminase
VLKIRRPGQKKTSSKEADASSGSEIMIGLVGPVGVDFGQVVQVLREALSSVHYSSEEIRLSELLHDIERWRDLAKPMFEDERIHKHMDAGNDFRDRLRAGDALALLAIGAIREYRQDTTTDANIPCRRKAFLLRSLKHPAEVSTLRRIYGLRFLLISASAKREVIVRAMARRIADSHNSMQSQEYVEHAEKLIRRDESEAKTYGQNVRETFPLADLFINVDEPEEMRNAIMRFVEAIFGYPFHMPRRDEYAMFHAQAAALRSAQLGRQVGAAIATEDGDIIAVGTNEVPKAGGGLYWEGDEHDRRDHVLGYDSSDAMKRRAFADVLSKLRESGWLAPDKSDRDIETLVEEALKQTNIKGTQLMNTIEFMRAVHAEMAALINAATRGVSVKGCTLHATTFPCHDCAKHIVAAGISRVVYIEPYPKSLAADLYPDSVAVEGKGDPKRQVPFDPFVGIAPRKYIELFTMGKRKDGKGKKINWDRTTAVPKSLDYTLSFYPTREAFYYEKFQNDMIKAGLSS